MNKIGNLVFGVFLALCVAGNVHAADINISTDIGSSTTWTSDNVYNLTQQIYVLPGATLTIEPGTLVRSTAGAGGSLAVTRGAKIYVNGTATAPVIMTSTSDTMTGWREGANEWGNLTVMGDALISASHYGGIPVGTNTKYPTGLNEKQMEGLTAAFPGDPNVMYGGPNDDDDSGSISYLSLRYGGKVLGLANELNGLSLGAIGRETDIHHVEIMNNVDDGIEIWGGTVNIKYASIWNVGDDSFDVDEGWRGKAQFVFIVQGYSTDASQGSGVGDNAFETDGAEDSDAQPVTTTTIYNATVIGQPIDGDGGTTWRDNARVQYRNCIFMDLGEYLVRPDYDDGDGANGYGYNGTLSFANTWATNAGVHSLVNAIVPVPPVGTFNHPDTLYQAQTSGKLAEITDSVFFRNLYSSGAATAYNVPADPLKPWRLGADQVGVTISGGSNPAKNNVVAPFVLATPDANMPIAALTRGAPVVKGGKTMVPVVSVDPRAANDAVTSADVAPLDGFFTPAPFRGAFSPTNNWLANWTAADAYGMTVTTGNVADPTATIELTASTFFQTTSGLLYTVEESSDNKNWSPVKAVVGDGTIMSYTDLDTYSSAKFYRTIVQ